MSTYPSLSYYTLVYVSNISNPIVVYISKYSWVPVSVC